MSFPQFLLYFLTSMLIFEVTVISLHFLFRRYMMYRLKKQVHIIPMEEIIKELGMDVKSDDEDGTWH